MGWKTLCAMQWVCSTKPSKEHCDSHAPRGDAWMKKIYACGDRNHGPPRPHRNSPKNNPNTTFFMHTVLLGPFVESRTRVWSPGITQQASRHSESLPSLSVAPKYDCNIHKFGGGGKEGKEEPLRFYQTRRGIGRVCIGKGRDASNYVWCWGKEREREREKATTVHKRPKGSLLEVMGGEIHQVFWTLQVAFRFTHERWQISLPLNLYVEYS